MTNNRISKQKLQLDKASSNLLTAQGANKCATMILNMINGMSDPSVDKIKSLVVGVQQETTANITECRVALQHSKIRRT
ncbi:hypothetical protein [Vibrio jasicida]|uniref:hypothetical protein n=1 Tax=Vibrio jasicida TaxID=766224 RepID=UPI000CE3AA5B|nr:hypothetical protein [Vibrio jasicida]